MHEPRGRGRHPDPVQGERPGEDVAGLASAALFGQGVLRDSGHGEPVVHLDLSKETDWMAAPFRVWRDGRHRLLLSSVNHDDRLVGRPFRGEIEVRIVDPNGTVVLERGYPPGSTGHEVPSNYGDVRLDSIQIHAGSLGRWALRVRVTDGDAGFETIRSEVKLRADRRDLGMGGLINTVMILPAGLLLVLATLVAVPLARRTPRPHLPAADPPLAVRPTPRRPTAGSLKRYGGVRSRGRGPPWRR